MDKRVNQDSVFKSNISAIALCVTGWTAWVFTDTISKYLTQDYSIAQIICLANIITAIVTFIWLIKSHGLQSLKTPLLKLHLLRGLSIVGTAYCVVSAIARIPLADFYGIIFLSPLVFLFAAHFLLKEMIGWHRILASVVGFGGVLILAGPQFNGYNTGITFAMIAVLFVCANSFFVRKMKDEPALPLFAFFPALFNAVVFLPFMAMDFRMPEAIHIPLFLVFAPLIVTGLIAFTLGFNRATETAIVMPFHYTQMIWGVALGYLLFGDVPTVTTIIGSAIIIGSGLYIIWREHQLHLQSRTAKA